MRKSQFNKILFLVIYWTSAAVFYVIFQEAIIQRYSPIGQPYNFLTSLIIATLGTIIASTLIASFEILYFHRLLLRRPFGRTLIFKTGFYLISIFIVSSIAIIITYSVNLHHSVSHPKVINAFSVYLFSVSSIVMMSYWGMVVMSGLFMVHINDYFGKGVLVNFLIGRYHIPKDAVRIFMFMDMKASTTYAEEYGRLKYSHLIQDCFYDLTEIVHNRNARVYQYVGDEVILTWQVEKGIENNNCIQTFFDFDDALKKKKDYYINTYGILPEFKAGIHYGEVIITEISGAKAEIAYHGDTINTAARIQSVCNDHKKKLMASAELLSILSDKNLDEKYSIVPEGITHLKGKKHEIGIFSIDRKEQASIKN